MWGGSGGSGANAASGGVSGSTLPSGGSGGNAGYEVAANFIKGPVSAGSCEVFEIDADGIKGDSLGAAGNSVDGLVNFPSPINYNGSVLIECRGGTYRDEVTGITLDSPGMRAVSTLDSNKSFVVSPLTELAVQLAEFENDLDSALTTHNSTIADLFGIQGDITVMLPNVSLETDVEEADRNQYFLALTLISQLDASNSSASVGEIISGIASDLEDGDLSIARSDEIIAALETLSADADSSSSQFYNYLQYALADYYGSEQPSDATDDNSSDNGDDSNGVVTPDNNDDGGVADDLSAPIGYSLSGLTSPITAENQANVGFNVVGAEPGTIYSYSIYSSGNGDTALMQGTDSVISSDFSITGLDLSGVEDGLIEVEFYLTDAASNVGGVVTERTTKYTGVLGNVIISGTVTFDRVPADTTTGALDYDNTYVEPARGVTVEAVNSSGVELASTVTDASGNYSLEVTEYTDVRIRVLAEMINNQTASWDVSIRDNTSANAMYVLQGGLINTESSNSIRDLHAASGWGGFEYTGTRSAAPFAILDNIYSVMAKFVSIDGDIDFPALDIFWSINNNTADGSISIGDIGSSVIVTALSICWVMKMAIPMNMTIMLLFMNGVIILKTSCHDLTLLVVPMPLMIFWICVLHLVKVGAMHFRQLDWIIPFISIAVELIRASVSPLISKKTISQRKAGIANLRCSRLFMIYMIGIMMAPTLWSWDCCLSIKPFLIRGISIQTT